MRYFPVISFFDSWIHRIMVATHTGLAVAIAVGGLQRFPPPTYQPLSELADGKVWLWAIPIGISAMLMVSGNLILDMVGLLIGVAWMSIFSALFAVAMVKYPEAGSTSFVAYAGLMSINAGLLTQRAILWSDQFRPAPLED